MHTVTKLDWLAGQTLTNFERLGPEYWRFEFGEGCILDVETDWRIMVDNRIVLVSRDHGVSWGRSDPIDVVQVVKQKLGFVSISWAGYSNVSDLIISFSDETLLQIINLSSLFEAWNLHGSQGEHYIGMGGGDVAVFGR